MYDSNADAYNRNRLDINPMSQDYINKVQERRKAFGVTPLGENGMPVDRSALTYCENIVYGYLEELIEKKKIESL